MQHAMYSPRVARSTPLCFTLRPIFAHHRMQSLGMQPLAETNPARINDRSQFCERQTPCKIC
eukprot:scaffold17098_cov31-Prasinocladus_malaysianus.AAC.2